MSVEFFENQRWGKKDQAEQARHLVALEWIKEGKVLDLGCGDGLFLNLLKNKSIEGEGIDISEQAVNKCLAKRLKAKVFNFENHPLPYPDDEFEYTVMLDVLEHLFFPEKLLSEAARVSKHVIIAVPNFNSLSARIQMLFGKTPENNYPSKGHIFWFNYKILKDMIDKPGLKVEQIKFGSYKKEVPILNFITKFLAEFWPGMFALSLVVKCKK